MYYALGKIMGAVGIVGSIYSISENGFSNGNLLLLFAGLFWILVKGFSHNEWVSGHLSRRNFLLDRFGWWVGGGGFALCILYYAAFLR